MITKICVRNFKRFEEVEIELGPSVVFIGPNNSGKTTALQALALWRFGLGAWLERRGEGNTARRRVGVTINRKDIVSVPVLHSLHLWRNLSAQSTVPETERKTTNRIKIEILVSGVFDTTDTPWTLGMQFHYAGPETLRCQPFFSNDPEPKHLHDSAQRVAEQTRVLLLPPMSGLASTEVLLQEGSIDQLLGQGKSADVLRNLCYAVYSQPRDPAGAPSGWDLVRGHMQELFGVSLHDPEHIVGRGELTLSYAQGGAKDLDISSAGRGLQQTLLLLSWLYKASPGSVLLLDEPDAHLEFLRQQQIYSVLKRIAADRRAQIIAASHSEVLLNEASSSQDKVIVFVGRPHVMNNTAQTRKALTSIGFDNYIKAEQTGWVLYVEGATDLEILRRFAERLGHARAQAALARPFVHYVQQPARAYDHFFGLREAKPELVGLIVMDRLERDLPRPSEGLPLYTWTRKEIENYFALPAVLERFAKRLDDRDTQLPLFETTSHKTQVPVMRDWTKVMQDCVRDNVTPAALNNPAAPFWLNVKATDDFLDIVFDELSRRTQRPRLLNKGSYHELITCIEPEEIDPEVGEMLDRVVAVAARAQPTT